MPIIACTRTCLPINGEFPELIQSHSREARIDELLGLRDGRQHGIEEINEALRTISC